MLVASKSWKAFHRLEDPMGRRSFTPGRLPVRRPERLPVRLLAAALAITGAAGCAAKAAPAADGLASAGAKAAGSCGTVPYRAPGGTADLSALPKPVRAGYNGYFAPVNRSVYESFKAVKGPYRIGYSDSFSANSWRGDALARMKADAAALKRSGVVAGLTTSNSNLDNSLQIQQISSMINQHVDAIIAIPNSPTAFNGVIKQAYDAGIPFITLNSHVTSPYAINVDTNYHLTGELVGAAIAKVVKGAGNVLVVDGIDGSPASTVLHDGYTDAFAACPGIKVAGAVEGQWSEATAKTVMLQYLSTHPGQLAAVVNAGGMSDGVLQAFSQTGRTPVPQGDANPDVASLRALHEKLPDRYAASTTPPAQGVDAAVRIALGVLKGQGLEYDTVVADPPQVTGAAALSAWAGAVSALSPADQAPPPPGTDWLPASGMSVFFAHPGTLPALP
jgi:ribose transport system substrate-binding protein